jgi:DNA uptake protein ComE-like DNA-binding protein
MIQILRGTKIQQKSIDKIIKNRPYSQLDELESKAKISKSMRDKIEDKRGYL